MGPCPMDPKVIEGWIRTRMGIDDIRELRRKTIETVLETGADLDPMLLADASVEELMAAAEKMAGTKQTNGFKRDRAGGLYIEGRTVKAMLKENIAIEFPYQADKWGLTRKAPRAYAAEHFFIDPDEIYLGRSEPDGIDTVMGHHVGPQGPRSTLTYVEYCYRPTIEFDLTLDRDAEKWMDEDKFEAIWISAQENGLGAMRSMGHGRFNVLTFDRLSPEHARERRAERMARDLARNGAGALR